MAKFLNTALLNEWIPRLINETVKDKEFKTQDAKLKVADALNSDDKKVWATNEFGAGNFGRIIKAGEQLFFHVGNSKRVLEHRQ